MNYSRDSYFDFLKGVAIVMVVFIHTTPNLNVMSQSYMDLLLLMFRQVINVSVPLFIVISGYFCGVKRRTVNEHHIFMVRQLKAIYIPCLVWSIPYLLIAIINGKNLIVCIVTYVLCGYSVYYFIILLFQYYYFSEKLKRISISGGVIISMLTIMVASYLIHIVKINLPLFLYAGLFPLWIMFFVFGLNIGMRKKHIGNIFTYATIAIIGVLLSIVETKWLYQFNHSGMGIKISSFIMSLGICGILLSTTIRKSFLSIAWPFKLFSFLGRNSLGIYYIHCYWISALVLTQIYLPWGVKAFLAILFSVFSIVIIKRISPTLSSYLGFR